MVREDFLEEVAFELAGKSGRLGLSVKIAQAEGAILGMKK